MGMGVTDAYGRSVPLTPPVNVGPGPTCCAQCHMDNSVIHLYLLFCRVVFIG